jgi:formylmethanofuran dehydrogenase subunit D
VFFLEKLNVILISGRTTEQGVGLEEGKQSEKYVKSIQHVQINPLAAENLNLKEDDVVDIATESGSVSVYWKPDQRLEQELVFFPYGIWANQLFSSETEGTGMPPFKGISATLSKSVNNQVTSLEDIIKRLRKEK